MRTNSAIIFVLLLLSSCFMNEAKQRAEEVKLSTKEDFCALYEEELRKACEAPLDQGNINWSALNSSLSMSDLSQGNIIKNALNFCIMRYAGTDEHQVVCDKSVKYAVALYLKKSRKVGEKPDTSSSAIYEGTEGDLNFSQDGSSQMGKGSLGQ